MLTWLVKIVLYGICDVELVEANDCNYYHKFVHDSNCLEHHVERNENLADDSGSAFYFLEPLLSQAQQTHLPLPVNLDIIY